MVIEKAEGGFIVITRERKFVTDAEHVARLIHGHWHDVMHHIRELECHRRAVEQWESEGGSPGAEEP